MKKLLLIWVGMLMISHTIQAHNPLVSRFELKASLEQGALLDIYLTQAGVHNALEKTYPKLDFTKLSIEAYKKLVVKYIRAHTELIADGKTLTIGVGAIKLGNHETDLRFYIQNYPEKVKKLVVNIDAFKENENHQTIFWWYTPEKTDKVILSAKNDYTYQFGDIQLGMTSSTNSVQIIWNLLLVFAGIMGFLVVFIKKNALKAQAV